jgi:hypothetical protein
MKDLVLRQAPCAAAAVVAPHLLTDVTSTLVDHLLDQDSGRLGVEERRRPAQ